MSKYRIVTAELNGETRCWIDDMENGKVFNGYDFMGSVNWEDYGGDAYWADPDEAEQIIRDLEAADENPQPEIVLGNPELSYEISECGAPLETVIEIVERENPGWRFDRTEARYESCLMAIFTRY